MKLRDVLDNEKLDLEQAKANFEIETDPHRHDEVEYEFDRMGVCKNCESFKILYGSTDIKYWCLKTMRYWSKRMIFCEMNKEVARAMNGYFMVTEAYVDGLDLDMVLVYCHIYGIEHNKDQWLDDEYIEKEDELKVKLMDEMCKERKRI